MIEVLEKDKRSRARQTVDYETRRKKQQTLMVQLVERKVRSRAKQLYETRGQEEGQALQDWFQAESEVLKNSILAPLYRKLRTGKDDPQRATPPRSLRLRIPLLARTTRSTFLEPLLQSCRVSRKAYSALVRSPTLPAQHPTSAWRAPFFPFSRLCDSCPSAPERRPR